MGTTEDLFLAEAERDVQELEQHIADQRIRINDLHRAGRGEEESKAREGLFLLSNALELAQHRLRAERRAPGIHSETANEFL